ncbi:MAG: hypothetical protein ACRDQ7_09165 [Haloechinothrix sp.]
MHESDIGSHPDLQRLDLSRRDKRRARAAARRARKVRRRLRLGSRTLWLLGAFITVPIVLVALITYWVTLVPSASTSAVQRTPVSPTPTTRTSSFRVQLDQPFAATPAAGWSDGIDGITVPEPEAIGSFTTEQVADALKQVRDSIAAAHLDLRVLERHDVEPFLQTPAPDMREVLRPELRTPLDAAGFVTFIDESHRLLPVAPKTRGTLTVQAGDTGELKVTAKFAVTYAFDTDHPDRVFDPMDIVTVQRSPMGRRATPA